MIDACFCPLSSLCTPLLFFFSFLEKIKYISDMHYEKYGGHSDLVVIKLSSEFSNWWWFSSSFMTCCPPRHYRLIISISVLVLAILALYILGCSFLIHVLWVVSLFLFTLLTFSNWLLFPSPFLFSKVLMPKLRVAQGDCKYRYYVVMDH